MPEEDESLTRPASSETVTLASVKLILALEPGSSSTRPSLPRLTTALEFGAVVIVLSEKTVAPEIALWPLTVTWPDTDSSPDGPVCPVCPGDASTTIEYTL